MSDPQSKIDVIEAEMRKTQKNKATNYHLGTLKAKLAKLRSELVNGPGGKSAGSKDAGRGFDVTKSGDTRIGLVGFPSVGKSTLLTTLTGTRSEAVSSILPRILSSRFSAIGPGDKSPINKAFLCQITLYPTQIALYLRVPMASSVLASNRRLKYNKTRQRMNSQH